MTIPKTTINLLPKDSHGGLLKTAIGACLGASAVMVWALAWGPGQGYRQAEIDQSLSAADPAISASPGLRPKVPKVVSDSPANSLTLGPGSDTVRYYEAQTGRAFQANLRTGKTEILSDTRLPGFVRTFWSSSGDQVVSEFDRSGQPSFRYFNYTTKKSVPIGQVASAVAFSPNGQQLAFIDTVNEIPAVYLSQADGSAARKILATRTNEPQLEWPQPGWLALTSQRSDKLGQDLALINLDGQLSVLLSNKQGLKHVWSRDGQKLIFSYVAKDTGLGLWYLDAAPGEAISLSLATSADKCAWTPDSASLICGVSSETNLDDVVILNLNSGEPKKIYSAQKKTLLKVSAPLVSSSGSFFIFTNPFDQRIYSLEL